MWVCVCVLTPPPPQFFPPRPLFPHCLFYRVPHPKFRFLASPVHLTPTPSAHFSSKAPLPRPPNPRAPVAPVPGPAHSHISKNALHGCLTLFFLQGLKKGVGLNSTFSPQITKNGSLNSTFARNYKRWGLKSQNFPNFRKRGSKFNNFEKKNKKKNSGLNSTAGWKSGITFPTAWKK